MSGSKKFTVVCSLGSMFALMAAPLTHADENKPALDAEAEKSVRQAVYNYPPTVSPIPQVNARGEHISPPITIVVVPEPVPSIYKKQPRAVLELLLRIMDGANPRKSSQAAGYAFELIGPRGRGLVCIEFFDEKTYDTVDKDWEKTPRQHWIKKVRAAMAAMKLES